jgi:hypothetical protein
MEASVLRTSGDLAGAEAKLAAANGAFADGGATDLEVAYLEYERGLVLRGLGRKDEAAASLQKAQARAFRAGRLGLASAASRALAA